jgi:hypothetical protein
MLKADLPGRCAMFVDRLCSSDRRYKNSLPRFRCRRERARVPGQAEKIDSFGASNLRFYFEMRGSMSGPCSLVLGRLTESQLSGSALLGTLGNLGTISHFITTN